MLKEKSDMTHFGTTYMKVKYEAASILKMITSINGSMESSTASTWLLAWLGQRCCSAAPLRPYINHVSSSADVFSNDNDDDDEHDKNYSGDS